MNCLQKLRHLSRLWTDLVKIWCAFYHTLGQKSTKLSAKSVYRRLRKGVSNTTFGGKIQQHKFNGPSLVITQNTLSMVIVEEYLKIDVGSKVKTLHWIHYACQCSPLSSDCLIGSSVLEGGAGAGGRTAIKSSDWCAHSLAAQLFPQLGRNTRRGCEIAIFMFR